MFSNRLHKKRAKVVKKVNIGQVSFKTFFCTFAADFENP